jgi:hypothetical protein
MLLAMSALITLTAVFVSKVWLPAPASLSSLGLMSERWLAEQRAARTR